jgi:hypothetical protein
MPSCLGLFQRKVGQGQLRFVQMPNLGRLTALDLEPGTRAPVVGFEAGDGI